MFGILCYIKVSSIEWMKEFYSIECVVTVFFVMIYFEFESSFISLQIEARGMCFQLSTINNLWNIYANWDIWEVLSSTIPLEKILEWITL